MRRGAGALIAALLWAGAAQAGLQWQSTGPGGGGAFSSPVQSAAGDVIVGSDLSGAYRSIDGGQSWQVLGAAHGLTTTHIDSVAFHPMQDGVVLLAGDDGLYRSTDCGHTADAPCHFRHMLTGYATTVAMGEGGTAYVAGLNGFCQPGPLLARSDDGGVSWKKAQGEGLPGNANIMALRIKPGHAQTVIALSSPWRFAAPGECGDRWPVAAPAKAYLSTDGGDHFTALDVGSLPFAADAAFDLVEPKRIWLTVAPDQSGSQALANGETWISDDLGAGFKRVSSDHAGQIWPLKDGSIRLLDLRRQRPWMNKPINATDEAGFWQLKPDGTALHVTSPDDYARWDIGWSGLPHNPQASLNGNLQTFSYADDATGWWVDDQFIYKITDGGHVVTQSFTNRVKGGFVSRKFDNAVPAVLAPSPADPNTLYAGYFDMGCWMTTAAHASSAALTWKDCNGPKSVAEKGKPLAASPLNGIWNGYGGNTTAIAAHPKAAKTFWAVHSSNSFEAGSKEAGYPKITKTTDGFETWTDITGNLTALSEGAAITDLATDGQRVWAASGNHLFKLDDGSKNWAAAATPCDGGLQVLGLRGRVILAGGAKGVCTSEDGGVTWVVAKNGFAFGAPKATWWGPFDSSAVGVTDFAFASADGKQAYMSVMIPDLTEDRGFAGLWKSADGGLNWTQVKTVAAGPLERNFMRSVAVNPKDPKMIVAGTSNVSVAGGYTAKIANMGAFVSRDGGATWTKENDGLAWSFVTRLRFTTDGTQLFAISPGQGIVTADVK